MEAFTKSLSERDRRIVFYGGIVLGLFLFYFVLWSPLSAKNESLAKNNEQTRELIGWMKGAKSQLIQLHKATKNKGTNHVSLLSAIEQSVKRNRLESAAADIKQLSQNSVQVSFPQVDYLAVIRWIEDVQMASQSKIEKVSLQKTTKPGVVHVEITLRR